MSAKNGVQASVAAFVLAVFSTMSLAADSDEHIPIFTPTPESSWQVNYWDFILPPPVGAAHGPIETDPSYPYTSQIQNGRQVRVKPDTYQIPIVNAKDPILKRWAAAELEKRNVALLKDRSAFKNVEELEFRAQSRCYPGGVPGQLLFLEPVYFLQTRREVTMMWQRQSLVRHIYLADKHSQNVKPSWSGESIGHYENGDTLVVDTIGIAGGKHHDLDSFGTPHTDKLHVVERYTMSSDKNLLTAMITVEDPDTFNSPLTLKETWRRTKFAYEESVCAEDGGEDYFHQNLEPIPSAARPDF